MGLQSTWVSVVVILGLSSCGRGSGVGSVVAVCELSLAVAVDLGSSRDQPSPTTLQGGLLNH